MTTNVYDVISGVLASDSRWSFEESGWFVFVDDTGYDKIIFDDQLGFLFAGDMGEINHWKQWVAGGRTGPKPLMHTDEISLIAVDMLTGAVPFSSDYLLQSVATGVPEAWYGGTGGPYAKNCWQVNRCAQTAIASAKAGDQCSGGNTMYLVRSTKETNVTNSMPPESVNTQCRERGIMINLTAPQATLLVKDAANDPANPVAQEIAKKVMAGSVKLGAPFPGMRQPWTLEKKQELSDVLDRYAPKK